MELVIVFGGFMLLGMLITAFRLRRRGPRPQKIKQRKEKPRKFATPPTARVAEIKPKHVERSMNEDLRRFVAKGMRAVQDETAQ